MKQLIDHIQKSIWNPAYYDELLSHKASFSWKYYWGLSMLLAVLMTIITSLPLIPKVNQVLHDLPTSFFAYYPDELAVQVVRGHVVTNVTAPYFLPLPKSLKESFASTSGISFLGVIDTTTPVTLAQLQSFHTLFWISENSIAYIDQASGMRVTPLPSDLSFTMNESGLHTLVSRVEPYFRFAAPVLVLMIFAVLLARFVLNLAYLLVAALLILLLGLLLKRSWNYGTAYRIALHATTLPLLLEQIFLIAPLSAFYVPFLFTLLLLAVVYANYRVPAASSEAPAPDA